MELLILYAALALIFSFFCSLLEAALLSITPSFVEILIKQKPRIGQRLLELKADVHRPLAAILSLNTIANTMGATGVGVQSAVVFGSIPEGVIAGVLTLLILVFSEIIPKTLGAMYWRQLAPFVTLSVDKLVVLLKPLVWLSRVVTRIVSGGSDANTVSREEFQALTDLGTSEGVFDESESRIIRNLLRFRTLAVSDVMTPRTVVLAVKSTNSVAEVLAEHRELPFSRIPVYDDSLEDISGYVLKDELRRCAGEGEEGRLLNELRLDIQHVPDSMALLDLFGMLLERQEHIAVVLDEYGGLAGIVTMEDIIETLLGSEIIDETDRTHDMQALARYEWRKRARSIGLTTMGGNTLPEGLARIDPRSDKNS